MLDAKNEVGCSTAQPLMNCPLHLHISGKFLSNLHFPHRAKKMIDPRIMIFGTLSFPAAKHLLSKGSLVTSDMFQVRRAIFSYQKLTTTESVDERCEFL